MVFVNACSTLKKDFLNVHSEGKTHLKAFRHIKNDVIDKISAIVKSFELKISNEVLDKFHSYFRNVYWLINEEIPLYKIASLNYLSKRNKVELPIHYNNSVKC
jgi:hypothetical protein